VSLLFPCLCCSQCLQCLCSLQSFWCFQCLQCLVYVFSVSTVSLVFSMSAKSPVSIASALGVCIVVCTMQISISFTICDALYVNNLVTPTDTESRHQIQISKTPQTLSTVNTRNNTNTQASRNMGWYLKHNIQQRHCKHHRHYTNTGYTNIQGHYRHQEH